MASRHNDWIDYYRKLTQIYKLIESENSLILYQSMDSPLYSDTGVKSNYRAIIKLDNNDVVDELTRRIDQAKSIFFDVVGNKNHKLPFAIPKIAVDDKVFKIQVHTNVAHSSKNYTIEETVLVSTNQYAIAKLLNQGLAQSSYSNSINYSQIAALENQGYKVVFTEREKKKDYMEIYLDIKKLCELYKCQSIQHRIKSGKQTRANFFTYDQNGAIERSVLKSVGVLLLKPNQNVEVMHSHDRKIRTDAIYIEKHPDEIELHPIVDKKLLRGRIYKRFD